MGECAHEAARLVLNLSAHEVNHKPLYLAPHLVDKLLAKVDNPIGCYDMLDLSAATFFQLSIDDDVAAGFLADARILSIIARVRVDGCLLRGACQYRAHGGIA